MNPEADSRNSAEVQAKADQAKRIVIWVAAILMILPFILAWLTGSISF